MADYGRRDYALEMDFEGISFLPAVIKMSQLVMWLIGSSMRNIVIA